MAPTEGRVTSPERRWGSRRGTPIIAIKTQLPFHCYVNKTYCTVSTNTKKTHMMLLRMLPLLFYF